MKYLLPEWHDLVDRKYDFIREENSEEYKLDKLTYGARLWHLLEDLKLDGILVSRSIISSKLLQRIEQNGIKSFLGVPKGFEVLADCGAWQYIREPLPRYKPIDILNFYARAQVDAGVTLDHIAVAAKTRAEQEYRMRITYEYALEMLEEWKRKYKGQFNLLGAVQGIEVDDYVKFIRKLYEKGFSSFALGGLAKRNSAFIKRLIDRLATSLKDLKVQRLHFLGVTRLKIVPYLRKLENLLECEISTDSATALRIAWMRRYTNYLTLDGRAYIAIRIPTGSPNDRELISILRSYDRGETSFEEVWRMIKRFVIMNGGIENLEYYRALLEDKPWRTCPCKICREVGVDIVMFRGNERNRRRGFHNVWVFCALLKKDVRSAENFELNFKVMRRPLSHAFMCSEDLSKFNQWLPNKVRQIAIITYCTEQKNVDWNKVDELLNRYSLPRPSFNVEEEDKYRRIKDFPLLKAEDLYSGSFKVIKRGVETLRKKGVYVDVFFISARYGIVMGDDIVIPYDATLANKPEEWLREWSTKVDIKGRLEEIFASKKYDIILINLTKDYYLAVREAIKKLLNEDHAILILPKAVISDLNMSNVRAKLWKVKDLRERQLRLKHFFEILGTYVDLKKTNLLKWFLDST